jgi:nucleoside-diphosphate-sugar epimerase
MADHGVVRILVTGHCGHVGAPVAAHLEHLRVDGDDLLDLASVRRAVDGCAAVVHAGALAHDTAGSPEDIMAVNVLGTWHVLLAAEAAGAGRVIYFSSGRSSGSPRASGCPITSRSMTRTRAAPCAPMACPSAWPRTCARVSPPGPASYRRAAPGLGLGPGHVPAD